MTGEFNRMTIVAAAEVVSLFKSHNAMELLEIQWDIADDITASSKDARAASWARLAIQRCAASHYSVQRDEVLTEIGPTTLARAIVETAIGAPPRDRATPAWNKFLAGLRRDGYEITVDEGGRGSIFGGRASGPARLVRMLPDLPSLNFREAEDEVNMLLERFGFSVARGHLQRAFAAFERGEWSGANGELRNFYESYLNDIADRLGSVGGDSKAKRDFLGSGVTPPFLLEFYNEWHPNKTQYVQALMNRMHPHGGHPGLSEEEDATFRLQINLITARLFLRRLDKRVHG